MIKLDSSRDKLDTQPIGAYVALPELKEALMRVLGQHGVPAVAEIDECREGMFSQPEQCVVISHATERKKYEQVVITEIQSGVSARVVIYAVGKSAYMNAGNGTALRVLQAGWNGGNGYAAGHHSLVFDLASSALRKANAKKAQVQEMYYQDVLALIPQAVALAQSGQVSAPPVQTPAANRAAAPQPVSATAPRPKPAPKPRSAPKPKSKPSSQSAPQRPTAGSAPSPAPRPQQPAPQQPAAPSADVADPAPGTMVRTVAVCPSCGAKVRVQVPVGAVVNITCGRCGHRFQREVRLRR